MLCLRAHALIVSAQLLTVLRRDYAWALPCVSLLGFEVEQVDLQHSLLSLAGAHALLGIVVEDLHGLALACCMSEA